MPGDADSDPGPHAPLTDLRVLEIGSDIAIPFAGKLLADLGADVTKLEWPDEDPARRSGPFPPGREGESEFSGLFVYLNGAKTVRRVTGLSAADFVTALRAQVPHADVVILGDNIDWVDVGLPFAEFQTLNPRCIVTTVSAFGFDGPYAGLRAYDSTVAAAGGISFGVGEDGWAPLPLPMSQSSYQAGLCTVIGILLALIARERDGYGQRVDISMHEVVASLHCGYFLPRYLYSGGVVGYRAGRTGGAQPYPNTVLRCADGLVLLSAPKIGQWLRFLDLIGNPSWAKEPRYRDRRSMQHEYKNEVDELVESWLCRRTKRELLQFFLERRIPCAPILTGADICADDHLTARQSLERRSFPDGEQFVVPATPVRFRAHPSQPAGQAGLLDRVRSAGSGATAPLTGITVLDLGTAWAGGIAGRILGDFGADVIKVESWSHMDGSRMGRPIVVDDVAGGDTGKWPDLQPGFHVHGRNKQSVTLNLKSPAGIDLLYQLAGQADVLLHNYPPATAARLGLTESDLRPHSSHLVIVGQSIAGTDGPYSDLIGYAGTVAALSGLANAVGYPGREPIGMMEGLYSDVVSALTTVIAAVAGLVGTLRGAMGPCSSDVSQWEATLALCAETVMAWSIRKEDRASMGYASPTLVPQGAYAALPDASEQEWVCVSVGSDREWQTLTRLMNSSSQVAAGWSDWDLAERIRHADEIDSALAQWLGSMPGDAAVASLRSAGLAAAMVCSIEDIFVDPQLGHRSTFVDVEHPLAGIEPMPGIPWKLMRTPGVIRRPAPLLGEHTRHVLRTHLDIDDATFAQLVASGAIEVGPPELITAARPTAKGRDS